MFIKKIISMHLLLLVILVCISCSHEKNKHIDYVFKFSDKTVYPLPLKIHIILMKSDFKFLDADFFDLQAGVDRVLGDDLIAEHTAFLLPGTLHDTFVMRLQERPSYSIFYGIFAEYENLDRRQWRISSPFTSKPTTFSRLVLPDGMNPGVILINLERDGIKIVESPQPQPSL